MEVQRLDDATADRLRAQPLTYDVVGQSALGPVPGFGWFELSACLRRRDFEAAATDLLSWQIQARSGLRVWASDIPLRVDTVVLMRLGVGRALDAV